MADGKIGPATLAAAAGHPDAAAIVTGACDRRMSFLRGLKTWGDFGKGWTRRVTAIRAEALAMVYQGSPAEGPAQAFPKLPLWLVVISGFLKRILGGSK